jgi:hypothetical protein
MPTAADVGADPAGTAAGLVDDLSGVSNQSAARSNLGLGTAAVSASTDFAAASHTHNGTQVTIDASGFNGNLTTSDDTVQKVAQKVDDLVIPAAGIAATIIDAKGDLIAGTAADTAGRVPVGANGLTLTSDSTQAAGVKWEAAMPGLGAFSMSGKYVIPAGAGTSAIASSWPSATARPYVMYLPPGTIDGLGLFYTSAGASGYVAYCWMYSVDNYLRAGDFLRATGPLVVDTGSNTFRYGAIDPLVTLGGYYALMVVNIGTGLGATYRGLTPPGGGMQPFTVWNSSPDVGNGQPTLNNVSGLTATPPTEWPNKNNGSPGNQQAGATPMVIVRYA